MMDASMFNPHLLTAALPSVMPGTMAMPMPTFNPMPRPRGKGRGNRIDNSATNAKTTLVEFCQRYSGHSMNKGDIVYNTTFFAEHGFYQATVSLACVQGKEFAGELALSEKEAEQSAAQVAVDNLQTEIAALPSNKRKALTMTGAEGDELDMNNKAKLREVCKQVLGRDLVDADFVFEEQQLPDSSWKATVKLPSLPGMYAHRPWDGDPSPYKRDAIVSACTKALAAILSDPTLGPRIDLTNFNIPSKEAKKARMRAAQAAKGKGKLFGKGKGKGPFMWPSVDVGMPAIADSAAGGVGDEFHATFSSFMSTMFDSMDVVQGMDGGGDWGSMAAMKGMMKGMCQAMKGMGKGQGTL